MDVRVYIYSEALNAGFTKEGACALLAQIRAESAFKANNVQDSSGYSDEAYTTAVDNGTYTKFADDRIGYGIYQLTDPKRKSLYLRYVQSLGSSIGDLETQMSFLLLEMKNYFPGVWKVVTTSHDLYECTKVLLTQWERPAEQVNNLRVRYAYAQEYYEVVKNQDSGSENSGASNKASVVEKYTQAAINIANDNSHGYSQANRWGPDYDCSSLVCTVVQYAGIPVKDNGATYTGNMRRVFLACGFKDVTASCNLANGAGMQRGDILLNDVNHTAIYIGNGQLVHARSSEGNSTQGDQSGNEIRVQNYYNYPWNIVMRYGGGASSSQQTQSSSGAVSENVTLLRKGSKGANVRVLQQKLIELGYGKLLGDDGADGDYGEMTEATVAQFQKDHGLEVDGVFGPETYAAMKDAKPKEDAQSSAVSPVGTASSASAAVESSGKTPQTAQKTPMNYLSAGTTVKFIGGWYYMSPDGNKYRACKPGKARISQVRADAKHPYHLVRTVFGGSTVNGWVDVDEITAV